mmetsp:Transcript_6172/g.14335  ORF Transcript_6172/g.14335 Transcript_6172/m.14335 type:complete len:472 (+) Transcript_6172:254-1669(+)|eukprot:CAMPEP_0206453238 /NCGR_PEP_ID=MMETSP0324_2-20121206/20425_1 /ASSEMBLY_ACC=CAM_ASM_000836 /TAXON_ID=2866 /ORGANISM="Crypthecodinium cohnii, Strain Seligo" /LENGTH=471 /DNA_ID=CAMNT_0053923487 /DNA_START=177 /DNA_END=1592 /DNA_ORIENTATION=-
MPDEGFKLFVGDLPFDIRQEELQQVFTTYGTVLDIHIMPPNSRTNNKCALLFYADRHAAEDAIAVLNGKYHIRHGAEQAIKVAWAREKGTGGGANGRGAPGANGGHSGPNANGQGAPAPNADPDGFKLFVGGLPMDCTQDELTHVFSTYGEVNKVHVMQPHAETGRVAAFVYYKESSAAEDAITVLHDQYRIRMDANAPILVKWAQPKEKGAGKGTAETAAPGGKGNPPGPGTKLKTPEGWKLFVGGLPPDITEADIETVFSTYGNVVKVHMMPANTNGKVAAFVYYTDDRDAGDAIEVLNNQYKIRVDAPEAIQVRWATDRGPKGKGNGKNSGWQDGDWSGANNGWQDYGDWKGEEEAQHHYPQQTSKSYRGGGGRSEAPESSRLLVGNLPHDITGDALRYVFSSYGQVRDVELLGGHKLGSSYVEMALPHEAESAYQALSESHYEIRPGCGLGPMTVKRVGLGRRKPYA